MTAVFVDVEKPVRDWLRSANLSVGSDVYIGLPTDATLPAIEVTLLDGGIMPGEAPVANAAFSFSVWGDAPSDRPTCAAIAWELAELLQTTDYADLGALKLIGTTLLLGPVPRFDPDGTPRYVIDAALALRVPQ